MSWKTRSENCLDRVRDGSHTRGSRNWNSKLTENDVRLIRMDKRPSRIIAEEYDVHPRHIRLLRSGGSWSWLDAPTKIESFDQYRQAIAENQPTVSEADLV